MSLRGKKSAFAVFKGKKASSLTNIADSGVDNEGKTKKSYSENTTPTRSTLSTLFSKVANSEKRKHKSDMKKIKKMLKSSQATGSRTSIISELDSSPSAAKSVPNADVKLKSMRPRGSLANLQYELPLKSNPDIPVQTVKGKGKQNATLPARCTVEDPDNSNLARKRKIPTTPPLPPRQSRTESMRSTASHNMPNSLRLPVPNIAKTESRKARPPSQNEDLDIAPPRPPKRSRLSNGSVHSPPPTSRFLGGSERTEPLPSHPSDNVPAGTSYMFDSHQEAARLFECLIHPVKPHKFFSELYEKKPLLVKRHMPSYNDGWFSSEELDNILRNEHIIFGKHLNVTTYSGGKRETHDPVGRAYPSVVWDYYQNGCSLRMMNPYTYSKNVWKLLSILQEYFSGNIGANIYLTPAGTQGFAPHYDDVEVFVLQLEGKKHWRLYNPITEQSVLARTSSGNFEQSEIGEPILDVTLEAGDLLYFPRGTIHQGVCEDSHSLHITVSVNQLNTWGDMLKVLLPQALDTAMEEDVEFRKALPRNYMNYMGVAFSESENSDRPKFMHTLEQLMNKLVSHAPVDGACDQMAKTYLAQSLPPVLTEEEKRCSLHGAGERWDGERMYVRGSVEIEPDTEIKLIRKGCIRMISEGEGVTIYHNLENTRLIGDAELQSIEVECEYAPSVEALLMAYPNFIKVDDLPLENVQDKVDLASTMYEKGLLITNGPLEPLSAGESSDEEDNATRV